MAEFTLDDYRRLLAKALSSPDLRKYLGPANRNVDLEAAARRLRLVCSVIDSMTPEERRDSSLMVNRSRMRRIAGGAGVGSEEKGALTKAFEQAAWTVKRMLRHERE
jgi:signal recognition particle GTPase